jgi:exoribonuclease-2
MLLAGEGAGIWAMQRNIPFPYIEQEADNPPDEILPGIPGSYQLRRCMRPRLLSLRPGRHGGLGLDIYTQVTSPLRRYTDLLAHIQIRAFLRGDKPLPPDEVAARMNAGEAASLAVNQAERASRNHWMMVYLSDKKDSVWDAVALEKKGNRWAVIIPALALETQVPLRKEVTPNDSLKLILKSASIPKGEAIFVAEE